MQYLGNLIKNNFSRILNAFFSNKRVFIYTFAFGLVAHGFVYFNEVFSHDSLYLNHSIDALALGRWGQALIFFIRSPVLTPNLIGFLSLVYLATASALFLDLFGIKNKVQVIVACGIMVTSFVYTAIAATYIYFLDINMLALLCAVMSCYVIKNLQQRYVKLVLSSILLCFSISLYQAYFQVFTLICGLLLLLDLINGKKFIELVSNISTYLLVIAITLLMYKLSVYLSLKVTSVSCLSSGYNSLNNAEYPLSVEQYIELILKSIHKGFIKILKYPSFFSSISKIILISINLLIAMYFIYVQTKKNKVRMWISLLYFLIVIPFLTNTVYILSKGVMHDLMKYSYTLVLLVPLIIALNAKNRSVEISENAYTALLSIICTILSLLIFSNTIFSNQVYLMKELESKSSLSIATRILDRIEMLTEFIPNKTRVCFIGEASQNPYFKVDRVIRDKNKINLTGSKDYVAFTYNTTEYYKSIIGINLQICDESKLDNRHIEKMPLFPYSGSVKMLNNQVVVKLGSFSNKTIQ